MRQLDDRGGTAERGEAPTLLSVVDIETLRYGPTFALYILTDLVKVSECSTTKGKTRGT